MNPTKKPKPKTLPSLGVVHKIVTCFQIFIKDMSITVGLPDIDVKVMAQCAYFETSFACNPSDKQSLLVKLSHVSDGHVQLIQSDVEAIEYYGSQASIEVALDIPTEKMCVNVLLKGKDSVRWDLVTYYCIDCLITLDVQYHSWL